MMFWNMPTSDGDIHSPPRFPAGTSGPLPSNWEVLLPLQSLRRLIVAQQTVNIGGLQEVLSRMPRLHSVLHYGDYAGERFHLPGILRGPAWLQGLADLEDAYDDGGVEVKLLSFLKCKLMPSMMLPLFPLSV